LNAGIEIVDWHGVRAWRLRNANGATALITEHGAHVLSWITADGRERLYLSPLSHYRAGVAIRGGIPVIFPQFGSRGSLPKHGFARTSTWRSSSAPAGGGVPTVRFELRDDTATRGVWPFAFLATLELRLEAAAIEVTLGVENAGAVAFDFTAALHTYLRVDAAGAARIGPLEQRDLAIEGDIDRVFSDAPSTLTLRDASSMLTITRDGFPDTVIWNPGPVKAAKLDDMPPDDWRTMLCVEAACVETPRRLEPTQTWRGHQRLDTTMH
jgi:glucose-6-phosphate 1-epimerase